MGGELAMALELGKIDFYPTEDKNIGRLRYWNKPYGKRLGNPFTTRQL